MSQKAEALKAMNTIVKAFNDESPYYYQWCYLIPDEADDEELEDIADNMEDIFAEACGMFAEIMRNKTYLEGGIYCDGKVYELIKREEEQE